VTEPGLRERHKTTTRRALEDAALRLFARDGYDATTVEAIAAEVEVSPRTFFRYFASKDEVFDMGWRERQPRLTQLVTAAPGRLDDLAAAGWALTRMAADFERDHERVRMRARAMETSATLRGRVYDSNAEWQVTLADSLASRRGQDGPDFAARVASAAAVALWTTAFAEWLRSPDSALADQVGAAFGQVTRRSATKRPKT
jgi:AcrR family transcriptional regulator